MENKKLNKKYVIIIAAVAATGGFLFGFDAGVISGAVNFLQDPKGWGLSDSQIEWVTTGVLLGAIIGAGASGRITDILGRKKVILAAAVIFCGGALYTGMAPDFVSLFIGRLLLGVAVGTASFTVPLYLSEISPTKMRGALVFLNQLMIAIGGKVSYLSDFLIANDADPYCWRWMFLVGFFPAVFMLVGMFFLPETPRWLISKGFEERGRAILKKVEEPGLIEESIRKIKGDIAIANESASYKEIFKPWLRNPLIIAVGIMFFQQVSGINTVIYYSPKIFKMAGIQSNTMTIVPSLITAFFVLFAIILSIFLIDKVGRRKIFFIGMSGMIVSLFGTGLAFYLGSNLGGNLKYIALVTILLYNSFFAFSLGPLGWLLISEMFPLKVRGVGMSIGSLSNWFFNAVVAFTFLKLVNAFSTAGAFWIYTGFSVAAIIWGYYFIPETKGVTLEEIEDHWRAGKLPKHLKQKATES
ncbi:MAG: MFS transporter [Bacteroidetes bacterium GWF2_42_66]|nr:MAG: MFS transporter [Bacteroidetes bacterium GWA2_42_15]OFX98124.1 MAG: MFS transporter [Bacteroidetes bacterium GWE2_42_39]OFY42508.1 MAG: MFS transporter [Bacteroidetes bacterium GWF2_42_66]HBL74223.1 sugar porter family MFS transporter [Prolixibacteraceae bacterium]HCU63992.1 sugar porter family MFS transporter [Prolixibacteraceae bacterium]